jgi:hypothetical protein
MNTDIKAYLQQQLEHYKQQTTYNDWEEARREGAVDALEDALEHIDAAH